MSMSGFVDPKLLTKKERLEQLRRGHTELLDRIIQQEVYEGEGNAAPSMYEELAVMERQIKKLKPERRRG